MSASHEPSLFDHLGGGGPLGWLILVAILFAVAIQVRRLVLHLGLKRETAEPNAPHPLWIALVGALLSLSWLALTAYRQAALGTELSFNRPLYCTAVSLIGLTVVVAIHAGLSAALGSDRRSDQV